MKGSQTLDELRRATDQFDLHAFLIPLFLLHLDYKAGKQSLFWACNCVWDCGGFGPKSLLHA